MANGRDRDGRASGGFVWKILRECWDQGWEVGERLGNNMETCNRPLVPGWRKFWGIPGETCQKAGRRLGESW